jgi:photosystem II stability/assembly factor-like uncharacterized protein
MKQRRLRLMVLCWALASVACSSGAKNKARVSSSPPAPEISGLQRLGEIPPGDYPRELSCVDAQHCWLQQDRKLWRTVDSGQNWTLINEAGKDEPLSAFIFSDQEHGWAIASSKLYKTQDSGETWIETATPFATGGEIRSIDVLDQGRTIWLAGGVYRNQTQDELKFGVPNNARIGDEVIEEAIYRSDDGGASWKRELLSAVSIGRIFTVQYFNRSHGIALGDRVVYQTGDRGVWKMLKFAPDCVRKEYLEDTYEGQPVSIAVLDSEWWWLAYSDGRIVKTEDGGRRWCDLVQPGSVPFEESLPGFFKSLHFVNRFSGWGLGKDNYLYSSHDSGRSWSRVTSDVRFDTAAFEGDSYGLVASSAGLFRILISK